MPQFKRVKTIAEIAEQCHQQKLVLDTTEFHKGSDYIVVRGRQDGSDNGAYAIFNVVTGHVMGKTDQGYHFNSDQSYHFNADETGKPWFQALLAFFLTNDNAPAAEAA